MDTGLDTSRPPVSRQLKSGIVHIGPSAFFRGHLAVIVDDLIRQGKSALSITAISLKTSDARDKLEKQDYRYNVVEQSFEGNKSHTVGSLRNILVAAEDPKAAVNALAASGVELVTLTVTQAGYYYRNGKLDFDDPDIRADLERADDPTSTVGLIVTALDRRRKAGLPPFTVMSCDNLPGNGTILRNVVLAYAAQRSLDLRDWIENNVSFPSTMVDRIVPKTTEEHIRALKEAYGIDDAWPIYTEPFMQMVIERPRGGASLGGLEKSDQVLIVEDVAPYELMKIRLLNGTHMALGMIGRMKGYTYTHEAIRDTSIRGYIRDLMNEMQQTLPPVPGVDIEEYKNSILKRLENPAMKDELSRLARNGVDKLDSRFLGPLKDALARGTKSDCILYAVASWVQYLKQSGPDFDILDKKALDMGLPDKAKRDGGRADTILSTPTLFDSSLSSSPKFVNGLEAMLPLAAEGRFPSASTSVQVSRKARQIFTLSGGRR